MYMPRLDFMILLLVNQCKIFLNNDLSGYNFVADFVDLFGNFIRH